MNIVGKNDANIGGWEVDGRWLHLYFLDALTSLNDCYVAQVLDEGHIGLPKVPNEK